MMIGDVEVGAGLPTRFIGEVSNNHNRKFETALQLVTAAKDAGCDFVKFQCYDAQELIDLRGDGPAPGPWGAQGYTMRTLYERAATPFGWFHDLMLYARDIGITPFASVFGLRSLALMESLDAPCYKLAALDFDAYELRHMVEQTGKPIMRSCPHEIAPKYDGLQLFAPPGYPQSGFRVRNILNGYDGFSYHGQDAAVGEIAASLGAKLVECHLQLDSEPSELEESISLTASQFARMVARSRQAEAA